MRFTESIGGKALITLAIALLAMAIAYPIWRHALPDCAAGQPGPCGLTTLLALLYSIATALGCALAAILFFAARSIWTRTKG